MAAEPNTVALRPDAVDWREVGGEIIAIERDTSTYLATNATGSELWQRLVSGTTLLDLIDLIVNRHGISRMRATSDVEQFLAALEERGLLVRGT